MHKFKIKLLYNEEEAFCSKAELLNFKITLPLARLDIVDSSSVTNGLVISDDILVDIQLVTFFIATVSNIMELSIETKSRKF